MDYADFVKTKERKTFDVGFASSKLHSQLFPFQDFATKWAIQKGRAALFEDCGLGKTFQQLEWAYKYEQEYKKPVLIFAPLAVSSQTRKEGAHFGYDVSIVRNQDQVKDKGLYITNYEMMEHFDPSKFGGIVLDESSILKNFTGKYRKALTEFSHQIQYRLACTATPAPNDLIEIVNHAVFLSVMNGKEIIACYFIQDGNTTHQWRLKGHASNDFWAWVSTWAMAVRKPSDLGFDDSGYVLPELIINNHTVDGHIQDGLLFPIEAVSLLDQRKAKRESLIDRVGMAADIANNSGDSCVVWCYLNDESRALKLAIPDAIEVTGGDTAEQKEDALMGFADGRYRVIITKPSIAGFGMNWQHCNHQVFVGVDHSFEKFYQAVRRCWRFGQTRDVTIDIIAAETESRIVANIERKQRQSDSMMQNIIGHMNKQYNIGKYQESIHNTNSAELPAFLKGV